MLYEYLQTIESHQNEMLLQGKAESSVHGEGDGKGT